MADFLPILKKNFNFEGGYQNDPIDPGNYSTNGLLIGTKYGISAKALERYLGHSPSVQEMKSLTQDVAALIYKLYYWQPLRGDTIQNDSLAMIIFTAYVQSEYEGLRRVKKGVNKYYARLIVPETSLPLSVNEVTLINKAKPQKLFDIIKQGEIDNRNFLARVYPEKYGKYLTGWLKRLSQINYLPDLTGLAAISVLVSLFFLVRSRKGNKI